MHYIIFNTTKGQFLHATCFSYEVVRLEFAYTKHHLSTYYQFFFLQVTFKTCIEFKLQGNKGSVALGGRSLFMSRSSVLEELHPVFFVFLVGN